MPFYALRRVKGRGEKARDRLMLVEKSEPVKVPDGNGEKRLMCEIEPVDHDLNQLEIRPAEGSNFTVKYGPGFKNTAGCDRRRIVVQESSFMLHDLQSDSRVVVIFTSDIEYVNEPH